MRVCAIKLCSACPVAINRGLRMSIADSMRPLRSGSGFIFAPGAWRRRPRFNRQITGASLPLEGRYLTETGYATSCFHVFHAFLHSLEGT
jgi:hypothetical protein